MGTVRTILPKVNIPPKLKAAAYCRVSLARISAHLEEMGIPSPRGKKVWSKETLRKILNNEKYKGSVTLQKTFVENYLEHKQIKNVGQLDIFQIDCNHKPIIYMDS